MGRFFRSGNLASRVFDRQLLSPRPGAAVNTIRQLYENLVPSYTIYDIDCPDYSFRKFTDDGEYLVAFSWNHQDLIVYRPFWLTYSCNEDCDSLDLPAKSKKFDSFFKQLYSIPLASSNEFICKDFFLYMECNQFGLFATSTAQSNDSTATEGAIQGVPSFEKITFYLVRTSLFVPGLEDGVILDEKAFCNDFINLAHSIGAYLYEDSIGAYLYEDLLCIVSLRYQTVHILQIRDSGNFVEVRRIGAFCREDDELFLHSHAQDMSKRCVWSSPMKQLPIYQKSRRRRPAPRKAAASAAATRAATAASAAASATARRCARAAAAARSSASRSSCSASRIRAVCAFASRATSAARAVHAAAWRRCPAEVIDSEEDWEEWEWMDAAMAA